LQAEAARLNRLLKTIDRTIETLREDTMTLTPENLYEGFAPEEAERYRRKAREAYGEAEVEEAEGRAVAMGKEGWAAHQAEGDAVTQALAELVDREPADAEVQALIARHHAWIEGFYEAPAERYTERYTGLAQLYVDHDEFRAFYERYAPGLAQLMHDAMIWYAEHTLNKE
jgi:hypothetical protein